MDNNGFFATKLGQASIASVAAMVLFIALSTQMHVEPVMAATIAGNAVEIA